MDDLLYLGGFRPWVIFGGQKEQFKIKDLTLNFRGEIRGKVINKILMQEIALEKILFGFWIVLNN